MGKKAQGKGAATEKYQPAGRPLHHQGNASKSQQRTWEVEILAEGVTIMGEGKGKAETEKVAF